MSCERSDRDVPAQPQVAGAMHATNSAMTDWLDDFVGPSLVPARI